MKEQLKKVVVTYPKFVGKSILVMPSYYKKQLKSLLKLKFLELVWDNPQQLMDDLFGSVEADEYVDSCVKLGKTLSSKLKEVL